MSSMLRRHAVRPSVRPSVHGATLQFSVRQDGHKATPDTLTTDHSAGKARGQAGTGRQATGFFVSRPSERSSKKVSSRGLLSPSLYISTFIRQNISVANTRTSHTDRQTIYQRYKTYGQRRVGEKVSFVTSFS